MIRLVRFVPHHKHPDPKYWDAGMVDIGTIKIQARPFLIAFQTSPDSQEYSVGEGNCVLTRDPPSEVLEIFKFGPSSETLL